MRPRQVLRQSLAAAWICLCFGFAAMNRSLLPDRYFDDSDHIQALALDATGPSPDSFISTAWVYRLFDGFASPTITALITLALFFVVVFRCSGWLEISRFGPTEMVLFCCCGAAAAIYLAQYSKESIVLLVVLALTMAPRRPAGELLVVVLLAGYAYFIRDYWAIIGVLYLAFRVLLRGRRPAPVPLFMIGALVCCAIGTSVVLGVDLNSFRVAVAATNSAYANTVIPDYLPVSGPVGGAANAVVILLTLVVPVPLALAGSPVYVAFAALMVVLWGGLFIVVVRGTRGGWFRRDIALSRAVSLLLAMVTVEAIFEPDYGSYIKHLTPLLPLFLVSLRARREARRQSAAEGTDPATAAATHTEKRSGPMRLSTILRAATRRWYITIPGVLLAATLAAGVFLYVPPEYTSSGIAMFVQPRNAIESLNPRNPLLAGNGSLNAETMSVAQALSSPDLPQRLGLVKGQDSYTVKNTGSSSLDLGVDHPFIYISTQANDPARAVSIVSIVMDQARQLLARDQTGQHVGPTNRISLKIVVDATTPQAVRIKPIAAAGTVGALAILVVLVATCAWDTRRERRAAAARQPAPPAATGPDGAMVSALLFKPTPDEPEAEATARSANNSGHPGRPAQEES